MNTSLSIKIDAEGSKTFLYRQPLRKPDKVVDIYHMWLQLYPSGEPYLYVSYQDMKLNGMTVSGIIAYIDSNTFDLGYLENDIFYSFDGAPIRQTRRLIENQLNKTILFDTIKAMFTDFYINRDLLEAAASE